MFLNVIASYTVLSFPRSSVGKESACNAGDLGLIPGFDSGNCQDPLDKEKWQPSPVFLPGESHGHGVIRVRHNLVTKPP